MTKCSTCKKIIEFKDEFEDFPTETLYTETKTDEYATTSFFCSIYCLIQTLQEDKLKILLFGIADLLGIDEDVKELIK